MKRILTFLFLFSSLFASSQTQFLGAPNTTIVVKGNMKVDSILYLPKREKTPTDTGALRYQISDSSLYVWTGNAWRKAKNDGTVTSVGLTMPSAFAVANSPVTTSGTLAVTATGSATEYIRGDGTLGTLPTSGGGGGSGVNYYLNGSVSQGTIGGSTYYEMNKVPVVGTGTNFTASADGLIAQFITDAGDPNRLLIPAGAWNFELYFSASSGGGTPTFYVELLKYDGTTFTSIASSSANPIPISNGTVTSLYVASLAVTETVLTTTDRLAIRVYTNVSGRTITFHTEDNNLAQVITTFAGGVVSLNGLTANDQFFATGTTGTNFNIASTSATHTFNLPTASATNRGALSSTDWSTFNNKVNISDTAAMLTPYLRKVDTATLSNRINLKLNISDTSSMLSPYYRSAAASAALALKVNISDTAAMLTNYIRHGGYGLTKTGQALSVDTSAIATRLRVQKGIDSVATLANTKVNISDTATMLSNYTRGSGTANYVPKWQGTRGFVNSQIFDNGTFVGINRATIYYDANDKFIIQSGRITVIGGSFSAAVLNRTGSGQILEFLTDGSARGRILSDGTNMRLEAFQGQEFYTGSSERIRITAAGDVGIGNISPSYKLDVSGTLRNTTGAAFATSSGNVLVGTTTDAGYKLDVSGTLRNTTGANFATSSGNVIIGGTTANNRGFLNKLHVLGGESNSITLTSVIEGTNGAAAELVIVGGDAAANRRAGIRYFNNYFSTTVPRWTVGSGMSQDVADNQFRFNNSSNVTSLAITQNGDVGIGNTAPSEKLHVTGRIRATTIDSTATGINMLYADANGVIKKAAVPSGGGGSVTSITAGTGLTGGTITTSGTIAVDTASIATRARVQKGIDSVATLANTKLTGTGISGYFPKWTGASTQDTSQLFQLGRNIGIGTTTPAYRIHLPDAGNVNAQAMIAGTVLGSDGNGQTIRPSGSLAMALFGQADIGYIYGAAVSSTGRWGINTRSLNDATFNVDGSVKIVTIDSTSTARNMLYQDANGVIKKSAVPTGNSGVINTSIAVASANYTVTSTDHFVYLGDLSSAGRNIVLPNDAVAGRQLIFFNTSNDATFKWTFTNEDVQDITGAAVTTLTNRKTYMLVFYEGVFHIISEN